MPGDWSFVVWLLILSVPIGLALAAYWAHGFRRQKAPKVPPGDPGNPT